MAASHRFKASPLTGAEAKAQVVWFWPGYIPSKGAIIVDGDSGVGKSRSIASWIRFADGMSLFPDGSQADVPVTGVLYVCGEMDEAQLRDVFVPQGWDDARLDKLVLSVYKVAGPQGEVPFSVDYPPHMEALKELIQDFHANVVVLDPFIEFFKGDENNTHNARHYVRMVQDLGNQLGVLFVLIVHWNKNEQSSARNRMSGSHQITATARARVSIAVNSKNPQRKIWHLEKALQESKPDLAFEIDEYGKVEWITVVHPGKSIAMAVGWLEAHLADKQAHFITDVRDAAEAQGYDRWQVKKAKEKLGLRVTNGWGQNGSSQKETWLLQ